LAASITRIDYVLDGSLFAVTNPALFSLPWDSTRYADGQHTLQVKAYDAGGVVAESSVTFTTQNTRPTLDLRTTLLNQVIKVVAYAKGQFPLTSIKLYGDGGLLTTVACTSSGCNGSYTWRAQRLTSGAHTVRGVVTDTRGITTSQTLQVTISGR
jgi:large repetitive protein